MRTPSFQIYECENLDCRFRCPTDLTLQQMDHCPVCGGPFSPRGDPFTNYQGRAENSAANQVHLEIALDNLRSTFNVGSIFRTADGAGVAHIHCCGTTPTPRHPKIAKSGLGAEEFVSWTYHRNAVDLLQTSKQDGFVILSLEATLDSTPLLSFAGDKNLQKVMLVIGNEVSGIDPEILALSDQLLHIPMHGKKSSLNVAVAFGIAVYSLLK